MRRVWLARTPHTHVFSADIVRACRSLNRGPVLTILAPPPQTLWRACLMSAETLEFLLLLSGWVIAFLLGRELQTGFRQWRLKTAEQRARRPE